MINFEKLIKEMSVNDLKDLKTSFTLDRENLVSSRPVMTPELEENIKFCDGRVELIKRELESRGS